jgi:hypothetical protein
MTALKKAADRRRWERLPLAIPVFVRGLDRQGRQFVDFATALNISAGGALLAIHRHLQVGAKVSLEIPSTPVSHTAKSRRPAKRSFAAKAVRVTAADGSQLVGLQFRRPFLVPREPDPPKARSKGKGASTV